MKSAGLVCVLIAILLMNLSLGIPGHSTAVKLAAEHPGAVTSSATTKHVPADLQIDRETASLPRPDFSSPAALPPPPLTAATENSYQTEAPNDLRRAPLDLLQLQHVLRI
jgi:hypothetical protein